MEKNANFVRIGTQIYLIAILPDGREQYILWNEKAIYQDYEKIRGNEIISSMPRYLGFVNEPSHIGYQPVIDGQWLNLYKPLPHQPKSGVDFPNIRHFLKHIFGDQYELGLDYLQLLFKQPKQKLPIILLVSRERNTGKTTFLKLLKAIFGENAIFNNNEDFKSQFNADWASKLIIMVDEAFLDKLEYTERLKNLSTASVYKAEAKGKDRVECDFHGKFVLCSNNIERPLIIDPDETRFWVRQIPRLKNDDPFMLEKLEYEIPAFLDYLLHRTLSTEKVSRMWFSFESYHTKALDRIVANNRGRLEQQMTDLILDIMDSCGVDEIQMCPKDMLNLMAAKGYHGRHDIDLLSIRKVLRDTWRLKPAENGLTYNSYQYSPSQSEGYMKVQDVGRFFTIKRKFIQNLTF